MFDRWGRGIYRARRLTLVIAVLFAIAGGVWGTGVFSRLATSSSFTPPGSQSSAESNLSAGLFGRGDADVVVLYRSATMTVQDPAYRQAVTAALARLPAADVTRTSTYWSSGQPGMVAAGGHATYAVLQLAGAGDAGRQKTYQAIEGDFPASPGPGITAQVGGTVPANIAVSSEVTASIARAEGISLPVLLILLVLIFGGLVAASLTVALGGLAILGSFTVLRLLTLTTAVSTYSLNITTILGLGLGIDYGLFVVTRFREELRRQPTVEQAVARTMTTAGRTVLFSGITVALALSSLILFPEVFLRTMGYGGVVTVAIDVIAAVTVLPALLAVLGHRVNALRVRTRAGAARNESAGSWHRLARSVMRRPVAYAAVIVIVLLALGAPFLKISWGGTDARALPAASAPRQVSQALASEFPANSTAPIEAVVTGVTSLGEQSGYLRQVDAIGGVAGTQVTGERGTAVRLEVGYRPEPDSPAARQIVTQIRALAPPGHATVLVGGTTASSSTSCPASAPPCP